jgi:AcrR family transcriptional regulator
MRRLGEALGVEAMSLYRHVPGREDLLDAVVQVITEEMETDAEERTNATAPGDEVGRSLSLNVVVQFLNEEAGYSLPWRGTGVQHDHR